MVTVHRASLSVFVATIFTALLAGRSAQAAPGASAMTAGGPVVIITETSLDRGASTSSGEHIISRDDLALRADETSATPTLHFGGSGYFFKLDFLTGRNQGFTTAGVGIYPINVGYFFERTSLFPYVSVGGTASVILAGVSNDPTAPRKIVGGVAQGRAAMGLKLFPTRGFALSAELCYSSWALGGMVASETAAEPTAPAAGGLGRIIDLSVGVEWL